MRANAGHQLRARTAARELPCMRDTLIARPLHAFVRAPIRFRSQLLLTNNGKRGGTAPNVLWQKSTIPFANAAARRSLKTSLALIPPTLQKRDARERQS
jgi:hypothetical protein